MLLELFAFVCMACPHAWAQEALDAILDRGYVAHWLIVGPFAPDVEGGVASALQVNAAPLGARDFLVSMGGVARARPEAGQPVQADGAFVAWQAAGAEDARFDLAPLFPEQEDGVSYAAFYTQAAARQTVFLEYHSALGARIWANGSLLRDIEAGPLSAIGVTQIAVTLVPGPHLFLFEIPGATFETLAEGAGISLRELGARALVNRTLLTGSSGYETALRLRRAEQLGDLYVVPDLEDTGAFSGTASDIRQDMLLTIFNPEDTPSTPVQISAMMGAQALPMVLETDVIPAGDVSQTTVPVPVSAAVPGQSVPISLQLDHAGNQVSFNATVVVASRIPGGRVYVLTGAAHRPDAPEDQSSATDRFNQSFVRQMILRGREPDYGFDLGAAANWQAALLAYPEQFAAVQQGVGLDHLGAWAVHTRIDERLVNGELLYRNLALGMETASLRFQQPRLSYVAWDLPGIAAQTPQLLSAAGLGGILSNLEVPGLPSLFQHLAPDGSRVLHRRQDVPDDTASFQDLRDRIRLTRRALASRGVALDVLLHESATPPPDPFFFGATGLLNEAYPPVLLQGGGPDAVFEQWALLPPNSEAQLASSAREMTSRGPGSVLAQPELKQAHAALLGKLRTTEFLATLAALWGAEYPADALDYAWRQALFVSAPERLGLAETRQIYADSLAVCRDALGVLDEVLRNAGVYAAEMIDTRANAPEPPEGARALVVFNPTSWERTEVCSAQVELDGATGFTVVDDDGLPQPFHADQIARTTEGTVYAARLRFLAREVPSLGYRCYYVLPAGPIPQLAKRADSRIENDRLAADIDPATGTVRSLMDKKSGTEYPIDRLNDILALAEDPTRTDAGWEIWTTGDMERPSTVQPEITVEATDWLEQATVALPFAGGTLTRRYALYMEVPSLFCETLLDGIALDAKAVVATFSTQTTHLAPVHGVPFGAQVGRRSKGVLDFRTGGLDNLSGTSAQPALNWVALSPNDGIHVGERYVSPLGPAAIIYGRDPVLKAAAGALQSALVQRGIPAALWEDVPHRPDPFWEDGTEFLQFDGDLDHGTAMRFVLGHPARNEFAQGLMRWLPAEAGKAFFRRMPGGAALFLEDDRAATGHAPVPTVWLAGATAEETAALAQQVASSIAGPGNVILSPDSALHNEGASPPDSGFALLFDGTLLASAERDGTLVLGLAHGNTWRGSEPGSLDLPPGRLAFRYAIHPFAGTWRDANVPRAAQAFVQPLVPMITDLHSGRRPPTDGLLRFSQPGLLVSALKPAGIGEKADHPRNGLLLRVWDALGLGWSGDVGAWTTLGETRLADFFDAPSTALPTKDNAFRLDVEPNAVRAVWLLPTGRDALGEARSLAGATDRLGAMPVRYWRHNSGAAPQGGMPVSVLLRDGVSGDTPTIEAVVANPGVDAPIEGVLYLRAAEGWSIDPSHVYYNLAPGAYARHAVSLLQVNGPPEARGATIHTIVGGVTYRDVLDNASPPQLEVARTLAQIKVTVRNRSGLPLEGHVDIVVPPRFWPELAGAPGFDGLGPEVPITVLPSRAPIAIPPYESHDVLFRISDPDAALAGSIRLSANGAVLYAAIPANEPVEE